MKAENLCVLAGSLWIGGIVTYVYLPASWPLLLVGSILPGLLGIGLLTRYKGWDKELWRGYGPVFVFGGLFGLGFLLLGIPDSLWQTVGLTIIVSSTAGFMVVGWGEVLYLLWQRRQRIHAMKDEHETRMHVERWRHAMHQRRGHKR